MPSPPRPVFSRSPTWPPATRVVTDDPRAHESEVGSMSAVAKPTAFSLLFDDDLDDHPEDHFLSPMYEHEDLASDSDEESDIEWDAGITDFALFETDRRRAQETDEKLDRRWDRFMSSQQSALKRAVERSKSDTLVDTTRPPLPVEDVPGLTPDSSPNIRDDLDVESFHDQNAPRPRASSFLTVIVTPPSPGDRTFEDDDDLPLEFCYRPANQTRPNLRKLQRPGLRHAHTMSGKLHSWKRPSLQLYSVGEDSDAEERAETSGARSGDESDS